MAKCGGGKKKQTTTTPKKGGKRPVKEDGIVDLGEVETEETTNEVAEDDFMEVE